MTDGDGMEVDFNSDPGNVVIANPLDCGPPPPTLELNFGDANAEMGANICVPLTVANFEDVVSFQFSICYNETVYGGVSRFLDYFTSLLFSYRANK